jgi:hypothetical protein
MYSARYFYPIVTKNWNFSTFLWKSRISNFTSIHPVGAVMIDAGGRTDQHEGIRDLDFLAHEYVTGCPKTSVQSYHSALRNIPEERGCHDESDRPWVSNPRPARLYCAARDHFCKLCICYKNYAVNMAVRRTAYWYFSTFGAANQVTVTGVALCHKKVGRPCNRRFFATVQRRLIGH